MPRRASHRRRTCRRNRDQPNALAQRGYGFAARLAVLVGCVGVASCGGQPEVSSPGLSAEQLQFASFWPRDYVLDLRSGFGEESPEADLRSGALRLGDGWADPEREGRWAQGDRSTVLVQIASRTDLNLYFEYRSPGVDAIGVKVNGIDVGGLPSQSTWRAESVPLAHGVLNPGLNTIELQYVPGPSGFPLQSEAGPLTVYFRTIGVIASDAPVGAEDEGSATSRTERTLTVHRPGTLLVPYRAERALASATVGVSGQSRWWRQSGISLRFVGVTEVEDHDSEALTTQVGGLWGRAEVSTELALDGRSGPGCFVLDIDVDPNGPPLTLDTLQIHESPPPPSPPLPALPEKPDVVLVILDAARADHFGMYGYSRDTSPNIDRLAAESLVFTNVVATAPYTLSSMATMLTGLSFTQHGVTERGHRLSESVTTLAELFQEDGYRTACLSANPNNSAILGLEQGCDVFVEFWRDAAPPRSLDPYRVSRRALDELATHTDPDQPLFLMLHYVPPHEPYTPAPGFDIFGDDDYDGTYDGTWETLRRVDDGRLEPTPADLAEVVSLYDGNLRTGDDALEVVLDALRQRERWDETVVLVTSDHGEAFLEHGRMGHNSTVYDEMLHVPFILRLPGPVPAGLDVDSVASLADVAPTLLAVAGIAPRSRLYGRDLLRPGNTGRRRVVSRSGGDRPSFGYRTDRWKGVWGRGNTRELYDVVADPLEQRDVYLERYETFECLDALLEWELSGTINATSEDGDRELSEEDLRTLRSLGYVR